MIAKGAVPVREIIEKFNAEHGLRFNKNGFEHTI